MSDASRPRVLLIVDDLGVVWPARHALEAAGYEVRWYGDGKAALTALDAFGPDLVIVDVMLPSGDGWTVVDTMRALPQEERPKLMVISEAVGFEQTSRIEGLGAAAVISRPFEIDQLVSQVARALNRG